MANFFKRASSLQALVDGSYRVAVEAVDESSAANTGLVLTVKVQNVGTSKWWDADTGTWVVPVDSAPATEVDAVNLPGLYELVVDLTDEGECDLRVHVSVGTDTCTWVVNVRHSLNTLPVAGGAVADPVETLGDLLTLLRTVYSHNQIVSDALKQLIYLQEDGETPALAFDLKDASGSPSAREVFEMTREA